MIRLLPLVALLSLACGASRPAAPGAGLPSYRVRTDPGLRTLSVRACFEGAPPDFLVPGLRAGRDLLDTAVADGRPVPLGADGLDLRDLPAGTCVDYTVDLRALSAASESRGVGLYLSPTRVTRPGLWLWRPADASGLHARLRFEVPADLRVSHPWPVDAEGAARLNPDAFANRSRVVFGRFPARSLPAGGGWLDVAVLGDDIAAGDAAVDAWLTAAGDGVARVYGGLPAPRVQVLLMVVPGAGVHFGTTMRGGGPGVMLLVGQASSPADLADDWTASHELFHLGMPPVQSVDAWFFEGFTTYYTYVAMARAGTLTPRQAWGRLHDGFRRGRGAGTGRTLADESASMQRTGAYWRVYWGGAAMALRADVALRRRGRSLDEVMRFWQRWSQQPGAPWKAEALLRRADRHLGAAVLEPLADALLAESDFPAVQPTYEALGLKAQGPRAVRLQPAPAAGLRDAIMDAGSDPSAAPR